MQPSQPCTTPITIAVSSLTLDSTRGQRRRTELTEPLVDVGNHLAQCAMLRIQFTENAGVMLMICHGFILAQRLMKWADGRRAVAHIESLVGNITSVRRLGASTNWFPRRD